MQKYIGYAIAKFDDGTTGNVIAAAAAEVRVTGTGSLATLYATNSTGGATLSNPLTTDSNGKFEFYAQNNRYNITLSKSGTTIVDSSLTDIVLYDVEDGGAQIKTAYEAETSAFTDAQFTKLAGIETGADVTDSTNVVAAIAGQVIAPGAVNASGDVTIAGGNRLSISSGGTASGTSIYSPAANEMGLSTNGAEFLRADSSGNVGINQSNPTFSGGGGVHIADSITANLTLEDTTSGVEFNFTVADNGVASNTNINVDPGNVGSGDTPLNFNMLGLTKLVLNPSGELRPGTDNTQDFGSASFRWAEFFAGNGTINTSDETQKTQITKLADNVKAAFLAVKDIIGSYQWLEAVDKKGELARVHIGVGAQSAIAEFTNRGLDWTKYSCFCMDDIKVYETKKVTESQQVTVTKMREKTSVEMVGGVPVLTKVEEPYEELQFDIVGVVDESGHPVMIEVVIGKDKNGKEIKELVQMTHNVPIMEDVEIDKPVLVPAGQRYGVRYNELIMGILASI